MQTFISSQYTVVWCSIGIRNIQRSDLLGKDSHEMVEGILGMVIEEKLEERLRTIQQEKTYTFTNEETCYLDLVKGNASQ